MAAAAAQVRDLLPDLAREQALEVTTIYSLAGTLRPDTPLITRPPLVAPHHTATMAAITGGGPAVIQPGAASLAHRGVLFLDQAPRYERDVLSALRQPLESGEITLARSGITVTFPARFILVIAASPCPCGEAAGPAGSCSCSPATRRRWLGRVSGPLLDRVDVKTGLHPAARTGPASDHGLAGHGPVVAHRVAAARQRAAARLAGTRWLLNAEVPAAELRRR
jgi:magnesium chelatase family protein